MSDTLSRKPIAFHQLAPSGINESLIAAAVNGVAPISIEPLREDSPLGQPMLTDRAIEVIFAACFEPAIERSNSASSLRELVGKRLSIAPITVKNYLYLSYPKLDCTDLASAVARIICLMGRMPEKDHLEIIRGDIKTMNNLPNRQKQAALAVGMTALVNGKVTRSSVARTLFISESTVANTLSRVYGALGNNANMARASVASLLAYTNIADSSPNISDALING